MEKENWTPAPSRLPTSALPHFFCLKNIWLCSGTATYGQLCCTGMSCVRCDKASCRSAGWSAVSARLEMLAALMAQENARSRCLSFQSKQITLCLMLVLSPGFFCSEERRFFVKLSCEIWRCLPRGKHAWTWHCGCEGGIQEGLRVVARDWGTALPFYPTGYLQA